MKKHKLIPIQQTKIANKLKVGSNFYLQKFIKFPAVGIFHSQSELLFAALLEGNPRVDSFTPQPFLVWVKGKRYIPDFYYVKDNQSFVIELKPKGKFDEEKRKLCEELFLQHNMNFKVIANEEAFKNKVKATNWLQIVRTLLSSSFDETENQELKILSDIAKGSIETVGDIIDLGDRFETRESEIALFNLIHKGRILIDLSKEIINSDMEVKICPSNGESK